MVGPGIRRVGRTGEIFSDHTDIRPTMLSLAGLKDDYAHDGRVLFEMLDSEALPSRLRDDSKTLSRLASAYKAINAPRGALGRQSLGLSTKGLLGDDATFDAIESKLSAIVARRNAIAGRMIEMLEAAAFGQQSIDEGEANALIEAAGELLESGHRSDD